VDPKLDGMRTDARVQALIGRLLRAGPPEAEANLAFA
jgi:hypothetical protein